MRKCAGLLVTIALAVTGLLIGCLLLLAGVPFWATAKDVIRISRYLGEIYLPGSLITADHIKAELLPPSSPNRVIEQLSNEVCW
jgi:hypothetical protein